MYLSQIKLYRAGGLILNFFNKWENLGEGLDFFLKKPWQNEKKQKGVAH